MICCLQTSTGSRKPDEPFSVLRLQLVDNQIARVQEQVDYRLFSSDASKTNWNLSHDKFLFQLCGKLQHETGVRYIADTLTVSKTTSITRQFLFHDDEQQLLFFEKLKSALQRLHTLDNYISDPDDIFAIDEAFCEAVLDPSSHLNATKFFRFLSSVCLSSLTLDQQNALYDDTALFVSLCQQDTTAQELTSLFSSKPKTQVRL